MSYGFTITNKGRELLTSLLAGETLNITKVMVGTGRLPDHVNPAEILGLISPKALATTSVPIVSESKVSFIIEFRSDLNGGLEEGFWINEYGVFATDRNNEEILLYYSTLGDYPQYINKYMQGAVEVRRYPVAIFLTTDNKVELSYPANSFVTSEEAHELIETFGGGEKLQAHLDNTSIHVSEADRNNWNSKVENEDLQSHVDSYISGEEGVHGIKVQDGKLMYLSEGTWIENDTGKDEMLDKLDSLTEAMGKPNPTDENKENIMNFLNLLYARENDKSDILLSQTLTAMLSVASLEWAIAEMNRMGRFGIILRKAFSLDANVFDNLISLYDVVNDSNVVNILLSDTYCNAMIHSCPTFLNAIENGSTYIDFMTGTLEGIQQLKSSYDSMNYIVNSNAWVDGLVRNSSVSYQILEDSRWRIRFYSVPNESTSERLFNLPEWYQYTDANMSAWEDLSSATSSLNQMPFKKFIDSYDKYIGVLNHNEKLYPILNNKGAASVMFSELNILTYGNDIIDSTNYIHIYNSFNTLNILFDNGLGNAMLSSRKWCALLVGVSASSTALSQKPDFVAFAKDKPIFIQEMSKAANNGAFSNAVFSNHTSSIISILKNEAYFESFPRTLESDINSDATIYYTPNLNGFLLITNVSRAQRRVGSEGSGTVALHFIYPVPYRTSQRRGLVENQTKTSTTGAQIEINGSGGGTTSYPVEVLNAGQIGVVTLSNEISEKNFVRMSLKYDFTEYISKE